MKWHIAYYNKTVFRNILAMPIRVRARLLVLLDRLEIKGPDLGMPHTRAMGKGLFEIRAKTKEGLARAFYCTVIDNEIRILHCFIKKAQKTPKSELTIAYKRLREVKTNEKSI